MDDSNAIAKPLLELSKALKSQKLIGPEKIEKIKTWICELATAWRVVYSDKDIFNKQHHIEHIIAFIEDFFMIGRCSEEGGEAVHPWINDLKEAMKSIANDAQRIANVVGSMQSQLDPKVAANAAAVQESVTGKKRGKYNIKGGVRRGGESLTFAPNNLQVGEGGLVEMLTKKGFLKEEWVDVYEFCLAGRVPKSWQEPFLQDSTLGDAAKEQIKFSKY